MEELIIGTIIKLRNGKEYIVADNCKINSVQYVILTNNEESDEEEIFVLKNCKDKNNQYFLQSTSEEEFNSVINYYRESRFGETRYNCYLKVAFEFNI